jgi:tetratricopeptide (TPR) repeat protein
MLAGESEHVLALSRLTELIRIAPDYAAGHFAAGEARAALQEYDRAIEEYKKSITADQKFVVAYVRLAALYRMKNQRAEAEETSRQLMRLQPESPLGYNEVACLLADNGDKLDEALKLANRAVELGHGAAPFLDTLGWVLYQRKEYAKAIEHFNSAIAALPQFYPAAEYHYHLGLAYHMTGANDKALSELELALKPAPDFKQADEVKSLIQKIPSVR